MIKAITLTLLLGLSMLTGAYLQHRQEKALALAEEETRNATALAWAWEQVSQECPHVH